MTNGPAHHPARPSQPEATLPLPWLLRRANQRFRAETRAHLASAGFGELPQPGFWALTAIDRGVRQASRLVGEMGISKQAVSQLLDTLVASGFVERRPDPTDRRRTELTLTPKGRRAVKEISAATHATERDFVARLGQESYALLARMLEVLTHEEA